MLFSFLGRMVSWPLGAIETGVELVRQSARAVGADLPAKPPASRRDDPPPPRNLATAMMDEASQTFPQVFSTPPLAQTVIKEQKSMSDMDLNDDEVKLVRYRILNLDRGAEQVLASGEELVWENLSSDGYKVWKTAQFMRDNAIADSRLRFLRVWFEVLDRYPREKLLFQEDALDRLKGIEFQLARIGSKLAPDA